MRPAATIVSMTKRVAIAILWFAAIGFGYEILWSVTEVPRGFGPLLAAIVGIFMALDQSALFMRLRAPRGEGSPKPGATAHSV